MRNYTLWGFCCFYFAYEEQGALPIKEEGPIGPSSAES